MRKPLIHASKSVLLIFRNFGLLGLLILSFVSYLYYTEHGSRSFIELIKNYGPYQINYSSISGNFAKGMDFGSLDIKDADFDLNIKQARIKFNPFSLTQKTVQLDKLKADNIQLNYKLTETDNSLTPPSYDDLDNIGELQNIINKKLDYKISISEVEINNLQLRVNAKTHNVKRFKINKLNSHALAKINTLEYQGDFGFFNYDTHKARARWDIRINDQQLFANNFPKNLATKGNIQLGNENTLSVFKIHLTADSYQEIKDISLDINGTLKDHQISYYSNINSTPIHAILQGSIENSTWNSKISDFHIHHKSNDAAKATKGTFKVNWQQSIQCDLNVLFMGQHPISLNVNINKKAPFKITGLLDVKLDNPRLLKNFIPQLNPSKGRSDIWVEIAGTALQPNYKVYADFKDVTIYDARINTTIYLAHLYLQPDENNNLKLNGNGTFGDGPFNISGYIQNQNNKAMEANIKLSGKNMLVSNTPEYNIVSSPELELIVRNGQSHINGDIYINEATIEKHQSYATVAPSPDIQIVSNKKPTNTASNTIAAKSNLPNINANINITLSDKVVFKGYGINTNVTGQLQIKHIPNNPTTAKGQLNFVNGKYRNYGKTFNIEQGKLMFAGGPIVDPVIDIKAQRDITVIASNKNTPSKITVGISFSGPLKAPTIAFYSNPSLADHDVFSYLITGKPQNEATTAQGELILQAVNNLGRLLGNDKNNINTNLADTLQLDQLGIVQKPVIAGTNQSELEQMMLVMGKQLSDKLYLQYSVGLSGASSHVDVHYSISDHFAIVASTGTSGSEADLVFSFESG